MASELGYGPSAPIQAPIRAAQYVRMSTDFQKYSIPNQKAQIARYAELHGMEVVRTYADPGRSGLTLEGRPALMELLDDIRGGNPGFEVLLVLDVSRWGRFQDADESAYYEFLCRKAGVPVLYCNEPFENDGSPYTTIVKSIKRVMAAEYSRELSTKIRIAKLRIASFGAYLGHDPGLGYRRMVIGEKGVPKGILKKGERKAIAADKIILVPGPEEEVALVNRVYCLFAFHRLMEGEIATLLNAEGLSTHIGTPWSYQYVHNLLTREKYIGTSVYNRRTQILRGPNKPNPKEDWIRIENAHEGIVPPPLFERVQAIMERRRRKRNREEMLVLLKEILDRRGRLSYSIINQEVTLPSAAAYIHEFGSLWSAYGEIGYFVTQRIEFIKLKARLREALIQGFTAHGSSVRAVSRSTFVIDGEWTVNTLVARFDDLSCGPVWKVKLKKTWPATVTVIARPNPDGQTIRDYLIFPNHLRKYEFSVREADDTYDRWLHSTLDKLFEMGSQIFGPALRETPIGWERRGHRFGPTKALAKLCEEEARLGPEAR